MLSSPCVADLMTAYFVNGTLPPENTVCAPSVTDVPFPPPMSDPADDDIEYFETLQEDLPLGQLGAHLSNSRQRGYLSITR